MKKNTVIITALSCTIALLAACAGNNTSSGNSTQNSKSAPESSAISEALTASESSPTENDTASDTVDNTASSALTAEQQAIVDAYPAEEFKLPDGTVKTKADVSNVDEMGAIYFDCGVMGYASPIYYDTFTTPDLVDFETMETSVDLDELKKSIKYDWQLVKAGDVLPNGLKVKSATTSFFRKNTEFPQLAGVFSGSEVQLEGEITYEGYLYKCEYEGYSDIGELDFYPDTTKEKNVPTPFEPGMIINADDPVTHPAPVMPNLTEEQGNYLVLPFVSSTDKKAVLNDNTFYVLGNVNTTTADLTGVFDDNASAVRAKVTIKDPHLRYGNSIAQSHNQAADT